MYWDVPRGASYGEKVMRKFKYTIKEEQGIHARPASFLIQEARTYESRITLRVKGKEADASNIIAVMALDVMCGQKVEVEICGTDEGVAYRGMKKFFEEFKAFALKGNMMDMAIGVLIGGAFSTLVTSLTDNIINPIIGILFQTDFSDVVLHLPFGINLGIGAFISAVINFIILAFVLFCMLKAMNKLMDLGKHEEEKPAEPEAPKAPTQEELLAEILAVLKEQQAANGK